MARLTVQAPSLIGGVSQQAAVRRLPSQVAAQDNAWASPLDGLRKRHPIDHVATVEAGSSGSDIVVHTIVRGEEKYIVVIGQSTIDVFTDEGVPIPVHGSTAPYFPDFTYIDQRRPQELSEPESFQAPTWTPLEDALPPEETSIPGPLGFGTAIRLRHAFVTIGNDGVYRQTVTGGTADERKHFSLFVRKPPTGATAGLRLVLHEGVPSNASFEAAFLWNGDDLELSGAPSIGVEARTVEFEDGWWRAEMTYQPDALLPAALDRVQIELIGQGTPGTEHDLDVFGAQLIDSDDWTFDFFPTYTVGGVHDNIRATTVQDFTFVSNASVPVRKGTAAAPLNAGNPKFHVFVRQGTYDQQYSVTFQVTGQPLRIVTVDTWDGTDTSTGTLDSIETQQIATAFANAITALAPEVAASQAGSILIVESVTTSGFDVFSTDDSFGDTGMVPILESVPSFSDLPVTFENDRRVRVESDPTGTEDDYWVIFVTDDGTITGTGKWHESNAPGSLTELDQDTMPHQLVRKFDDGDGTVTGIPRQIYFEWGPATWDERLVGDDDSNPFASFVSTDDEDRSIIDIFFHKGRLGFLSGLNVVLSQAGDVFDFWRSTVRVIVDSDPIDVEAADALENQLHAAVPFDERLVIFGTLPIFSMSGEPLLSPKTVELPVVERVPSIITCRPVGVDRSILFASDHSGFSALRELYPTSERTSFQTANLTEQSPKYIPGKIVEIAARATESDIVAAIRAGGDPNTLYIYKSFQAGRERLQSAVWRYPLSGAVRGMGWIEDRLFLIVDRGSPATLPEEFEITGGATPVSRTYTLNADFDEGTLTDVTHDTAPGGGDGSDQLQLTMGSTSLGFLMVNSTTLEAVVRIDASTGDILGAYRTCPTTGPNQDSPGHITVDSLGNAFCPNRAHNTLGTEGSWAKIGCVLGGTRCNAAGTDDPTGEYLRPPFDYLTGVDRDFDGLIHTSKGTSNILAWGDGTDGGNGGPATVTNADDELVLLYQRVSGSPGLRGPVISPIDGHLWLISYSTFITGRLHKFDKNTGQLLLTVPATGALPCGGFTSAMGTGPSAGILMSTGNNVTTGDTTLVLVRYDTIGGGAPTAIGFGASVTNAHGISVDPVTGHFWIGLTSNTGPQVRVLNGNGTLVANYTQVGSIGPFRGIAHDSTGKVWVADQGRHQVYRLNATNGTHETTVALTNGSLPAGVAVDHVGNVWVLNPGLDANAVQRIDPTGTPAVDLTVSLPLGSTADSPAKFVASTIDVATKAPTGTWTVTFDGESPDVQWGTISWNSQETQGSSINVFARASNTEGNLPTLPWVEVENDVGFTMTGQFIEVRAEFTKSSFVEVGPILFDLTIQGQLVEDEGGAITLEAMRVGSLLTDESSAFQVCLDRRITDEFAGVNPTYDVQTSRTILTLPYSVTDQDLVRVVTRATEEAGEGGLPVSIIAVGATPGANVLELDGDWTGVALWIGEEFLMVVDPGRPVLRSQNETGGMSPVLDGFESILGGALWTRGPLNLDLRVQPLYGTESLQELRGVPLFTGPVLSEVALRPRRDEFSIIAAPDDVDITIESTSHFATNIEALEWYIQKQLLSSRRG